MSENKSFYCVEIKTGVNLRQFDDWYLKPGFYAVDKGCDCVLGFVAHLEIGNKRVRMTESFLDKTNARLCIGTYADNGDIVENISRFALSEAIKAMRI